MICRLEKNESGDGKWLMERNPTDEHPHSACSHVHGEIKSERTFHLRNGRGAEKQWGYYSFMAKISLRSDCPEELGRTDQSTSSNIERTILY
jgi:hypothetical protein